MSFDMPALAFLSVQSLARRRAAANFAGVELRTVGMTLLAGKRGLVSQPTEAWAKYALSPSSLFAASKRSAPFFVHSA